MPTLTTADYLKYANLQMAAEAFIRDEQTLVLASTPEAVIARLIAGNKRSLKFPRPQAEAFTAQWEVVDQKANTNTGFSGTLFRNKANRARAATTPTSSTSATARTGSTTRKAATSCASARASPRRACRW